MRRLIYKILIFTGVLLLLQIVCSRYDNIDKHDKNADLNILRLNNQSKFDSLDILFVGSSDTYSGINPLFFDSIGIKIYNSGVAAAGPFTYELVTDNFIHSLRKKPRSIYFCLSPYTFTNAVDNFADYPIHRYLYRPLSNIELIVKYSMIEEYPGLVMNSFRKGIKNFFKSRKNEETEASLLILKNKGFYESNQITTESKENQEAPNYLYLKKETFNWEKAEYLLNYARALQNKGFVVVFFTLPTNKLNSFLNDDYLLNYNVFISQLDRNFIFLEESTIHLDKLKYRNSDHLNSEGAAIATKNIINQILRNSKLADL